MTKKDAAWFLIAIILASFGVYLIVTALQAPKAHADMCGPSNLPVLSYLNPYIKGCQLYLPGAGNLPQLPVPVNPGTAPAPIWTPPWGSWARP